MKQFDLEISALARQMPAAQRPMTIPRIGEKTATALVAAVGDASVFRNGREMAAWLGDVAHSIMLRARVIAPFSNYKDRFLVT